jgi:CxxC motif-containing protein
MKSGQYYIAKEVAKPVDMQAVKGNEIEGHEVDGHDKWIKGVEDTRYAVWDNNASEAEVEKDKVRKVVELLKAKLNGVEVKSAATKEKASIMKTIKNLNDAELEALTDRVTIAKEEVFDKIGAIGHMVGLPGSMWTAKGVKLPKVVNKKPVQLMKRKLYLLCQQ